MPRKSRISEDDWNGSIRQTYETDDRLTAVSELAAKWEVTPRHLRQVAKDRGWLRPNEAPPEEVVVEKVSPISKPPLSVPRARRDAAPKAPPPEAIPLPPSVVEAVPPETVAEALPGLHKRQGKAPPGPDPTPVPPDGAAPGPRKNRPHARASTQPNRRVADFAPPGVRAAVYAPDMLDAEDSSEIFKAMVTQQVRRTNALAVIFEKLSSLLDTALTSPDAADQAGIDAKAQALNTLLPGRMDSLSSILTSTRQLAEVLRAYEAGMMDVHAEAAKHGRLRGGGADGAVPTGEAEINFADLPVEDQARLLEAAMLLDGSRNAPDFPVPPTGPVIEHAEQP